MDQAKARRKDDSPKRFGEGNPGVETWAANQPLKMQKLRVITTCSRTADNLNGDNKNAKEDATMLIISYSSHETWKGSLAIQENAFRVP